MIIAVVGFGAFVLFRYIPVSRDMNEIKDIRAEQNLVIAKGISDNEQMQLFKDQLQKLRDKLEKYEANIPEQKDLGSFLKKIAELMEKNNLKEQAIQPLAEVKSDKLVCIPVNMEGRGSLSEIYQFYKNLQELDRQIRIKQVKLRNGKDFDGDIKMETEIIIYYRTQVG
jgi:Tfp pilus assembly protein PilO